MLPDLEYAALRYENFLKDVLRPLATPNAHPLKIEVFQTPDRVAVTEVPSATFEPVKVGWRWGPVWSTAWFRLIGKVPEEFSDRRVGLRFSSGT